MLSVLMSVLRNSEIVVVDSDDTHVQQAVFMCGNMLVRDSHISTAHISSDAAPGMLVYRGYDFT